MPKYNKTFSLEEVKKRKKIEDNLGSIPPFCECVRKILSVSGFIEYYEEMKNLYPTFNEAYERLEEYHIAIKGGRKYSDMNAFQVIVRRRERGK